MADFGSENMRFRDFFCWKKQEYSGDDLIDCVVSVCSFLSATVHNAIRTLSNSLYIDRNHMAGIKIRDFAVNWDWSL